MNQKFSSFVLFFRRCLVGGFFCLSLLFGCWVVSNNAKAENDLSVENEKEDIIANQDDNNQKDELIEEEPPIADGDEELKDEPEIEADQNGDENDEENEIGVSEEEDYDDTKDESVTNPFFINVSELDLLNEAELSSDESKEEILPDDLTGEEEVIKEKEKKRGTVYFNEIAWMGSAQSSYDEWLELYNPNDFEIDLSGWVINFWKPLKDSQGKVVDFDLAIYGKPYFSISFKDEQKISAKGFFLLIKEKYNKNIQEKADASYKGTLVNDGGYLEIKNDLNEQVDNLDALAGWPGGDNDEKLTLEKNIDDVDWHTASVAGGTPREKNSLPVEDEDDQTEEVFSDEDSVCGEYSGGRWFNEILPNPDGIDTGQEWIELKNENDFVVNLSGWKLVNSSGKIFSFADLFLEAGELKKIDLPKSFVVKNQKEKIQLFSCQNILKDEVAFLESAPSGRSYNRDENNLWRWSRYLTPGEGNLFNILPLVRVQKIKESYLNLPILFDASESVDGDGDDLKFIWDFGDGRKSYLEKVNHTFVSIGKKQIILKVSDGNETVEKLINLKVKKYPQRKISFVKILPNPQGTDTGKELIWLKSGENKRINLKGWKIFSGSSEETATAHPINQEIILRKGEEKSLSRQESLFSLNNKTGYLALVYPGGGKADELKYIFEKEIPEGAEYFLNTSGMWQWSRSSDSPEEKNKEDDLEKTEQEEIKVLGAESFVFWEDLFDKLGKEKTLSWREMSFLSWQKKNQKWLEFLPRIN